MQVDTQYTTFERLVGILLAYRMSRTGTAATTKQQTAALGRSSLSDWDLFMLGAASKLVATGGTYPYVCILILLTFLAHHCPSAARCENTMAGRRRRWAC